jgi:hypothetical protein
MRPKHFVVLLIGWLWAATAFAHAPEPTYSGDWWMNLKDEHQLGFLSGEGDCYRYEGKGSARNIRSARQLQAALKEIIQGNPPLRQRSVFAILGELRFPKYSTPKNGEYTPGAHGYYDGDWWLSSPAAARLGFVEAYVGCSKLAGVRWTHSPEELRKRVDAYYYQNGKERNHEHKIADVLKRADRSK